jgi:hypothetical protein
MAGMWRVPPVTRESLAAEDKFAEVSADRDENVGDNFTRPHSGRARYGRQGDFAVAKDFVVPKHGADSFVEFSLAKIRTIRCATGAKSKAAASRRTPKAMRRVREYHHRRLRFSFEPRGFFLRIFQG